MNEVLVKSNKEFKKEIKNNSENIIVKGKLAEQLYTASAIKNIDRNKLLKVFGVGAVGAGVAIAVAGPVGGTASVELVAASLSISSASAVTIIALVSSIGIYTLSSAFYDYDFERKIINDESALIFRKKKDNSLKNSLLEERINQCFKNMISKDYEYVDISLIDSNVDRIIYKNNMNNKFGSNYKFIKKKEFNNKSDKVFFIGEDDFGYFDFISQEIKIIKYNLIRDVYLSGQKDKEWNRILRVLLMNGEMIVFSSPIFNKSYLFLYLQYKSNKNFVDNDKISQDCILNTYGLNIGDILEVKRKKLNIGTYSHFAVYLGNDKVIQYSGEGNGGISDFKGKISIRISDFSDFICNDEEFNVLNFEDDHHSQKDLVKNSVGKTNITVLGQLYNNIGNVIMMMSPVGLVAKNVYTIGGIVHEFFNNKEFMKKSPNFHIYTPEETIQRAKSRLGEKKYNLVTNNCEHFALWCKTGINESLQVDKIIQFKPINKPPHKSKMKRNK